MSKRPKLPDLAPDERRILSIDIALMASKHKNSNDASSIIINSAKPNGKRYIANIVYLNKGSFWRLWLNSINVGLGSWTLC